VVADRGLILRLLHGGQIVSGAEIARRLGVSRVMVHKDIRQLSAEGCRIEAVPRRGYRLLCWPDAPRPEVMDALWGGRGFPVRFLPETTSTNAAALSWAIEGAVEGATVTADHQTAGRGRRGRSWQDPPGESLLASIVLRPRLPVASLGWLPLAVGLGAARAVGATCGRTPELKWPNDLLLRGRKVGGVLLELALEEQEVRHAVAGIGVNVRQTALGAEIADSATSLRLALGYPGGRAELLAELVPQVLRAVRELEDDAPSLQGAWRAACTTLGRDVRLLGPQGEVHGRAVDVDALGRLVIEGPAGRQAFAAGDVSVRPAGGDAPDLA